MLIPLVVLMHPCVVPTSSNQLGAGHVFSLELDRLSICPQSPRKRLVIFSVEPRSFSNVFAMTDIPPERLMLYLCARCMSNLCPFYGFLRYQDTRGVSAHLGIGGSNYGTFSGIGSNKELWEYNLT